MDNSTVFRSLAMTAFMERWKVRSFFRAAYRPSGNGIVERHHRTIKAMAERGSISPLEATFWYNMSPRSGQDSTLFLNIQYFGMIGGTQLQTHILGMRRKLKLLSWEMRFG